MAFIFWRAGADLGSGTPAALAPNNTARITSEQDATETEPVVDAADAAAIAGNTKQLSTSGKVCYSLNTTQLPAGTYRIYIRYRSGGGTLTVDQSSRLATIALPARNTATYTGDANINGYEFLLLDEFVTIANEATTVCIEASGTLYFDELYFIQTDSVEITDVNNIQFWGLDSDQYPASVSDQGLIRVESDDPLWSGDATTVIDGNAIGATAWSVGEDAGVAHELAAAVPNIDAGTYQVLLRHRFSGTSPDQGYLRFNQTGQTQQSLDVSAITPAATFDGTLSYNGLSGYYDMGNVTLVAGTLNATIVGPTTTGDAIVFDDLVLVPVVNSNNDTRTVYGTTRVIDKYHSGTPRQMLPKYGITLNGSTEYATCSDKSTPDLGTFTFAAWIRVAGVPAYSKGIAARWQGPGNQRAWLIELEPNGLINALLSTNGVNSVRMKVTSGSLTDSEWHHIAVIFNESTGLPDIYIDGSQAATTTIGSALTGTRHPSTADLEIGRYNSFDQTCFPGQIDDIRIYDTALTASQIADLAAIAPGSQRGANVGVAPLIHYKCEDPVTSATLRNSGSLGSSADATITGTIATVRGTASPVYSFANSVGGTQAWCSDGSDDYLDTQLTLGGATALTVYARRRYLSSSAYDFDGWEDSSTGYLRFGRFTGTGALCGDPGHFSAIVNTGAAIADGELVTMSMSAAAGGNTKFRLNGVEVLNAATTLTSVNNGVPNTYRIGLAINQAGSFSHHSHSEIHEYLIADRVLTDDELTWLETGGQAGTAIDFANDANILLYTDFSQQTATQIVNQANSNLPILKASGSAAGELTMVPRSESDTTKDVDQAEYAYRSALYVAANTTGTADFNAQLIPSSADFDISLDFNLFAVDATDTDQTILSQHTAATNGRLLLCIEKATLSVQLFVGAADGVTDIDIQSASNTVVAGKWHTARITRVGDVFTLYVDGVQQGTQTLASASIEATDTFLGQSGTLTTHDEFHGLISNLDFGSGQQYLTRPGETISGATLTNASYVDVVRGKPGTIQHTGIAPRDMVLTEPALVLNGTSEYVTSVGNIGLGGSELTFSAKFKCSSAPASPGYIINQFDYSTNARSFVLMMFTDGTVRASVSDATYTNYIQVDTSTAFDDGEWHEATAVFNAGALTLYVDKNEQGTETVGGAGISAVPSLSEPVRVGAKVGTLANYFPGSVADCKISTTAATGEQVASGGWLADILELSFAGNSGDFEPDLSGNGNDGTLVGTVANMRAGTTNVGSGTCVKDGYAVGQWLDKVNDYLDLEARMTTGAMDALSVQFWFRRDTSTSLEVLVSEDNRTANRIWGCYVNSDDTFTFYCSGDGSAAVEIQTDAAVLPEDELHHVSVVYDTGTATIRIDGDEVAATAGGSLPTALHDNAGNFAIGAFSDGQNKSGGVFSQVIVEAAAWSESEDAALRLAGKPSEVAAIRPNAFYLPDAKTEVNQSVGALTAAGAPEQRVIPVGPNAILPATHGPGLLPPDHSLNVYANESDSPYALRLDTLLADGTYDQGDDDEASTLFVRTTLNGDDRLIIRDPAAASAELTALNSYTA